jgi:4'-phosphopantetheinyl transferase EntD
MEQALEHRIAVDLAPIETALAELLRTHCGPFHLSAAVGNPSEPLDPAEEAVAEGMALSRRESFHAGRAALRQALQDAGHPTLAVTADEDGVPRFPDGYIGSIAHKHGRAVAVACRSTATTGIGIDLEFDECSDEADLLANVATSREVDSLDRLDPVGVTVASRATLVLSAKEALYKAVFPVLRSTFDFEDVELSFDPETHSFRALRFPGIEQLTVAGHYAVAARWIVCIATASR